MILCFLGRGTHITSYVWLPDPSPGAGPLSSLPATFSYCPAM